MPKPKRQNISPKRQPAGPEWKILARRHPRGTRLPPHQHQTGQLLFAIQGVMLVETNASRWTIPPQRALWLPPRQPHAIQMLSATELRTVYFQPALIAQCPEFARRHDVHAVVASPLIKELVLALFDERRGYPMRALMARLLLDVLQETEYLPTQLPMPTNDRLRAALMKLMATNRWQMSLRELASFAAMSERSFTRRFTEEVGMSFRAWRQRARIVSSLDLLASNRPIKLIAHTLQFASTAAYVAAFRELLGCTPEVFRGAGKSGGSATSQRVNF